MESETSSQQKFIRITGGIFNHLGLYAQSDYGRVFIPWMRMSHLALVIFERKGQTSLYLNILQKNDNRIFYIDGNLVNYKELLGNEITVNPESNLKILLSKMIPNLFETYFEPALLAYLGGSSYLLRRLSNLKNLMEYCEEIREKNPYENTGQDCGLLWNFSFLERQKIILKRRLNASYLSRAGFERFFGKLHDNEVIPLELNDLIMSLKTPIEYFRMASQIDPYFHLPYAGITLCALEMDNPDLALSYFERSVDCLTYPLGITEDQIEFYEEFLRKLKVVCGENRDFFNTFERFLGFSPHPAFSEIIEPLYEARGTEWYGNLTAAHSNILRKSYAESLEPIEKVITLYPEFPWAYHWQGVSLLKMGRPNAAQISFKKVLEKSIDNRGSSNTFTEMFLLKKKREDKTLLDMAVRLNPCSAWARYLLGSHSLSCEKNHKRCLYFYQRAILMDPAGPFFDAILNDVVEIHTQKEKLSRALYRKELQRGDIIGDQYQITQVFKGGMGIVYIAYEASSDTLFAVKTFQEKFLWDRSVVEMFVKEAKTWIKLDRHKNIVQAKFIKIFDEKPYLFLEFVRGSDLEKLLENGPLSVDESLEMAIQFCSGMSYAYNKLGIVHRDIKPSNCLLSCDGILKITDFGLARIFSNQTERELKGTTDSVPEDIRVTATRTFLGTVPYMAPERLLYMEPGDIRSDIYSFGVMLYQMLTGMLPFSPEDLYDNFAVIVEENPIPPHEVDEEIPEELSKIISRCLAEEREDRFSDFEELKSLIVSLNEKLTLRKSEIGSASQGISSEELLIKGNSLLFIGDYAEAMKCFEEVLRESPDSIRALSGQSIAFLRLRRYREALSGFDTILSLKPDSMEVLKNKGIAHLELGQHQEALQCLERVLMDSPSDAIAWWKRGIISRILGQNEEALNFFERSLSLDPGLFDVLQDKGRLLTEMGMTEGAIDCFNKALEINPASVNVMIEKGNALLKVFQFDQALLNFEQVLSLENNNLDALLGLALSLESLARIQEALKYYDTVLEKDPDNRQALVRKAGIYKNHGPVEDALRIYELFRARGDLPRELLLDEANVLKSIFFYEKAKASITEFIATEPDNKHALSILREMEEETEQVQSIKSAYIELSDINGKKIDEEIESLLHEGRYRESLEILNRAISLEQGEVKLTVMKGILLGKSGRNTEALLVFDDLLRFFPDNESAVREREIVLKTMNEKKKSEQKSLFRKFFSSNEGESAYDFFKKGKIYLDSDDIDYAIRCFENSLESEPENAMAWYYKGLALRSRGMYDEALNCFDNAIEIDDQLSEFWCARGEVEEKLERFTDCILCYGKSLQLNPLHFPAWIDMIFFFRELGQIRKSLIYTMCILDIIEHRLQVNPDNCENLARKAMLEYLLGRYKDSRDTVNKVLKEKPDSYMGLFIKALLYRIEGGYTQAIGCFSRLLEDFPENLAALMQLGHTYELLREYDQALYYYDKILNIFPGQEWTICLKSKLLFDKGIPEEGFRSLDDVLKLKSWSSPMLKAKALYMHSQGKDEEALFFYKKIMEKNPEDFSAHFNLAALLNKMGKSGEAGESVEHLADLEPYNPAVWILRGDRIISSGNIEDAELCYAKALEIDPSCIEAYVHKAMAQHQKEQNEEALRTIGDALKTYPSQIFLLNNYAYLLYHMNLHEEARKYIEMALGFDSRNEILLYNKAVLLIRSDQLSEAAKTLDLALSMKPGFLDGLIAKGLIYEFLELPQEALSLYEHGIKQVPRNADILFYRGNALYSMKKYDEAVRSYSQSLRLLKNNPLVLLNKGIALSKLNRREEAQQCFNQYRELDCEKTENPEELTVLPAYQREKLFALKVMGYDVEIIRDSPEEFYRSKDLGFIQSSRFYVSI